jgi:tetratricopeptide (TPR) repeat protein
VRVFGEAVRVLVFPVRLSADYSYDQIPLVTSMDGGVVLCGLALIGLATAVFLARRRAPAIGFGLAFFLLAWLLTSNLPVVIGTIFGERLLYMPSAGVCLALASALISFGRRIPLRGMAAVAIAALIVLGGARTWARNPEWKDNLSLFEAAAKASPRSVKALDGYASELFTAGRPKEAIAWAERSLAIYPSYTGAHQTLGKSLRVLANDEQDPARQAELRTKAVEHSQRLIELFGSSAGGGNGLADAWNLRGGLALDQRDADGALASFGKSLGVNPSFVPAIVGTGVALAMRGDRDNALARFDQALSLDPGNAEASGNASMLRRELAGDPTALANQHGLRATQLLQEKRLPEALAEFREAARLQPAGARAFLGIGTVLAAQADLAPDAAGKRASIDEAIAAFEHALSVEPENPEAHMNLGIIYLTARREPAKVAEHLRAYLRLVPGSPQRAQMEETIRRMDAAGGAPVR